MHSCNCDRCPLKDKPATKPENQSQLIEHMLSEVEAHFDYKGHRNTFIESLREQFDRTNSLSEKQVEGLRKFYERID